MADKDRELEKEYWKTMSTGKKVRHLAEYYLPTVLLIGLVGGFAVWILVTVFGPHDRPVLNAAFIDGYLDEEAKNAFAEELRELLGCTSKRETVSLTDGLFQESPREMMKLSVLYASGDLDLIVAPPDEIALLAGQGALTPVKEYLGDLLPDAGEKQYGVPLADSERFQSLKSGIPDAQAAVIKGSSHEEAAVSCVRFWLSE